MTSFRFLFSFLSICSSTQAYNFLVLFPYPVRSLGLLGEGFVKNLLDAGHEVTYISPFLMDSATANLHQINISSVAQHLDDADYVTIENVIEHGVSELDVTGLQIWAYETASMVFENENMKRFLQDKTQKFDVVIADFYECEIFSGLAALFDCPMVWSYSMGAHSVALRLVAEKTNPAYTADYLSSNHPPFTFIQRLKELWAQVRWTYSKRFIVQPMEEKLYRDTFEPLFKDRSKDLPTYEEIIYNASMILANDHTCYGNVPNLPANFKFIAGQHVTGHTKPLPKDLQQIMDNAKNGVIYFSMGSCWKSKTMPKQLINDLLKMFGGLKYSVIWKFEADLENVPANVHIFKWTPQPSILAHPNCLLSISHGGQLSSIEAVHYGVPVIGVPIFLDQFLNVKRAVAIGYAIAVKLDNNLPEPLSIAINEMTNNPKYSKKAKEVSSLYHDRPLPPGAELVYWVEHVARTRGALHLRSPALHVPWYQKLYLDLATLLLILITTIIIIFRKLFSLIAWKKKITTKKYN